MPSNQDEDPTQTAPTSAQPRKRQRLGMWQDSGANALIDAPAVVEPEAAAPTVSVNATPDIIVAAEAPVQAAGAPPVVRQRMDRPREVAEAATGAEAVAPQPAAAGAPKQRMGATVAPAAAANKAPRQRMGSAPAPGESSTAVPQAAAAAPPPGAARPEVMAKPANLPQKSNAAADPGTDRTHPAWLRAVVVIAGLLVMAVAVVLAARWLRSLVPVQEFVASFNGHATQPDSAPEGVPAWMGWQHFLNMFFIVLIIRTGLQVRTEKRPPGYWKPKENSFFSPKGNTPKKVSLSQWLHQVLDMLWIANGAIFIVLLALTGQWMRIVPTNWDVFPNMASTALQYASLEWPTENGWVHYNALQMVSYFLIVYVAAPMAILTGWRMSTWWPAAATTLNKSFPLEIARKLHFPTMLFFVAFTIVHVFLVFFTGALRNLNHMYTSRDVVNWWGLIVFLVSLVAVAAAWYLTKPIFTTPLATRLGTVTKN
jgi:thiosulfate reductase cytochrome b subunit